MPAEARKATSDDIDAISRTLAEAFHDDPIKIFLSGGKQLSTQQVLPFFDAFTRIQLPHGETYVTPGIEAAALWAPPGHWKVGITKLLPYFPRLIKLYGTKTLPNLFVLTDLEKLHPAEPHYYLEFIGTDPAHQGKGFGRMLFDPMVERADREGVGMYLENSKEQNLAFYGRFGFQVRQQMTHRRNGPPMWLMWRDPR